MRFKGFTRRVLGTFSQQESFVEFTPEHYKLVGVGYSPALGMPVLEAYELINKWNAQQHRQGIVYYL